MAFHPTYIKINLKKLKNNILEIKKKTKSLFCFPIKANAYGHGLIPVAQFTEKHVDYFAVSCLKEALLLKKNNIKKPILILGGIFKDQLEDIISNDIEFTISSPYKANFLKNLTRKAKIHIEVDTGMHRTGMKPDTAKDVFKFLKKQKNVEIIGMYSHLATADKSNDPFCNFQIETFKNLLKEIDPFKKLISHLANSSGIEFYKSSYKNFSMTRSGILSYGYPNGKYFKKRIFPIFSLHSKISFLKGLRKNKGISYKHTYITKDKTIIATIPIGYADGYKRSLSNIGSVLIKNKKYPIVGSICMDQLMVEINDKKIDIEDDVILIGKNKKKEITVHEIACLSKTIEYDILSSFMKRIPRIYIK